MNNKKLTALAITALITTSLAIWLSIADKSPTGDSSKAKYLLGNIDPSLIQTIVIGAGDKEVTINRIGNQFLVKTKDNYPADISEINNLITKCTDIQITELYTADPDNHKDLGVSKENASSQVRFLKADGSLLTGVIVGSTKEGGKGTYIRQAGKNEVYVTLENPLIRTDALNYIDQQLTPAISRENIESVAVTQSGEKYTLTINDENKVVPDRIKEGMILKQNQADTVFTALSSLRFTDVSKDTENLEFDKSYVCRLTDQTVYNVFLIEKDGKTFITCNAIFKGQAPANTREFSTQEEMKEKEAKYLARENAIQFSNKHSGWVYEISSDSAKNLVKPLDELFEKPETEESKDPNEVPAPAKSK